MSGFLFWRFSATQKNFAHQKKTLLYIIQVSMNLRAVNVNCEKVILNWSSALKNTADKNANR